MESIVTKYLQYFEESDVYIYNPHPLLPQSDLTSLSKYKIGIRNTSERVES